MTEAQEKTFSTMNFNDRVVYTDDRLGNHPDRIKSPQDLLKFKGQKVFIVVSPFGTKQNVGTCFIWEWDIGEITDQFNEEITPELKIDISDNKRYLCYGLTHKDCGLSLKDYNIVPNNYNNNCVFTNLEAAEAYVMYRRLQYDDDQSILNIEEKYNYYFTVDHVAKMLQRGDRELIQLASQVDG